MGLKPPLEIVNAAHVTMCLSLSRRGGAMPTHSHRHDICCTQRRTNTLTQNHKFLYVGDRNEIEGGR